jgi:ParB family chromosome partitioning protein
VARRDGKHSDQFGSFEMSAKPAASKTKAKPSAAAGFADMLTVGGLANMLGGTDANAPVFTQVKIADIKILPQHRGSDAMEEDGQTLEELGADIADQGMLQPVLVCENDEGPEPFRLIAGERRTRASLLKGIDTVPAMAYGKLTDEQINRIQYAENVHRLNLRQIDEAKVLQRDVERLGSVLAAAAHHNKSSSWVTKRIGLLDLPQQTSRLLTEQISADAEVIGTVKQIEKRDPEKAAAVVEELKEQRGKKGNNARETVQKAKDEVKPPKKPRQEKKPPVNSENVATPKDRSHEAPSAVVDVPLDTEAGSSDNQDNNQEDENSTSMLDNLNDIFADAKKEDNPPSDDEGDANDEKADDVDSSRAPALPPAEVLDRSYNLIADSGSHPKTVLEVMDAGERAQCKNWLSSFYEAGTAVKPKMLGREVAKGFRARTFANEGHGLFALVAFVTGAEDGAVFNLLDIFGSVKP